MKNPHHIFWLFWMVNSLYWGVTSRENSCLSGTQGNRWLAAAVYRILIGSKILPSAQFLIRLAPAPFLPGRKPDRFNPNQMPIHMRTTYSLVALLVFVSALTASVLPSQAQAPLSGSVLDRSGKPLPFATVSLVSLPDSSIVKAAASDELGVFLFDRARAGSYLIRVTAVGYRKTHSGPVSVAGLAIHIPALTTEEEPGKLAEVRGHTKKPFVEHQPDRMVTNVAQSIAGSSNTALEVLDAPGYGGRGPLTFDTRTALLSLVYNFGNQQLKTQRRTQSASGEETRRAN